MWKIILESKLEDVSVDWDGLGVLQRHETNAIGNLGTNARQGHEHLFGIFVGENVQLLHPIFTSVVFAFRNDFPG